MHWWTPRAASRLPLDRALTPSASATPKSKLNFHEDGKIDGESDVEDWIQRVKNQSDKIASDMLARAGLSPGSVARGLDISDDPDNLLGDHLAVSVLVHHADWRLDWRVHRRCQNLLCLFCARVL